MEKKCINCAKFLTCNKQKCKKITFVEAGILDKPTKVKDREWYETIKELRIKFEMSMRECSIAMSNAGVMFEKTLKQINKKQLTEDRLIIGYDLSENGDRSCLIVARNEENKTLILNCFYDKEAEDIYKKLTSK